MAAGLLYSQANMEFLLLPSCLCTISKWGGRGGGGKGKGEYIPK